MPESSNRNLTPSMGMGSPSRLIMSSPSLTILAVPGSDALSGEGTPPPTYRYELPSSSVSTAGSKSHVTESQLGVSLEISAFPMGSLNGPVGESASRTAIPFPLFAKYRKNLSLPSIFL